MSVFEQIELNGTTRKQDWARAVLCIVSGGFSAAYLLLSAVLAFVLKDIVFAAAGGIAFLCATAFFSCAAVYNALRPNMGKRVMKSVACAMLFLMLSGLLGAYCCLWFSPFFPKTGTAVLVLLCAVTAIMIPITVIFFNKTSALRIVICSLMLAFLAVMTVNAFFFDKALFFTLLVPGILFLAAAIVRLYTRRFQRGYLFLYCLLLSESVTAFLPLLIMWLGRKNFC